MLFFFCFFLFRKSPIPRWGGGWGGVPPRNVVLAFPSNPRGVGQCGTIGLGGGMRPQRRRRTQAPCERTRRPSCWPRAGREGGFMEEGQGGGRQKDGQGHFGGPVSKSGQNPPLDRGVGALVLHRGPGRHSSGVGGVGMRHPPPPKVRQKGSGTGAGDAPSGPMWTTTHDRTSSSPGCFYPPPLEWFWR